MHILITGAWQDARLYIKEIEKMGHTVCFMQNESETLPCPAEQIEGVVCNALFVHHPIEQFKALRYIQLTSAGYDRVPMEYVREHGIEIHNAKGVYSIPMAEFAVSGVLQLYKQSGFFRENQKKHAWEKNRGLLELYGKTVCMVGCGDVGRECAKRFSAFGCEIVEVHRDLCGLEAIKTADVVIVTIALTDETKHLIKPSDMKAGAVLVNISRGAVVDQDDLAAALRSGRISAVLDVFEEEPLPENSELWNMKNVIITPHNSFVGDGNADRLSKKIIEDLQGR